MLIKIKTEIKINHFLFLFINKFSFYYNLFYILQ